MDLKIDDEFWELVKKREAERSALGSTSESLCDRFPAAAGRGITVVKRDGQHEEQREAETERGSFQQAPASHRGCSPNRRNSPAKAADPVPDGEWTLPNVTLDRLSLERLVQQSQGERAE